MMDRTERQETQGKREGQQYMGGRRGRGGKILNIYLYK